MESRGQTRLVPGGRNEEVWLEGDEDTECQDGLEAISTLKLGQVLQVQKHIICSTAFPVCWGFLLTLLWEWTMIFETRPRT